MTYRNVLVHVKSYEDWSPHIDAAGRIAQSCKAHLTGLYTLKDIATLKTVLGPDSPTVAERAAKDAAASARAEAKFRDFLEQLGIAGSWTVGEGAAGELVAWASRFHDLVVVEQTDLGRDEIGFDVAEQCVLASGRPTLVVPHRGAASSVGRRVAIAWNGSREAARAVFGALPFIAKAEHIDVLLGRSKETYGNITRYPELAIGEYLRCHNRNVAEHAFKADDAEAGTALLAAASAASADLLVMGAYGRTWFSEWILGGATRQVLRDMTLPVLMGH